MDNEKILGDKSSFGIGFIFFDDAHETELSMYIKGRNILAFTREGKRMTTRWNLDGLAIWLRDFIDNMLEDIFPFEVEGDSIADKDRNAREFDPDDDDEFDRYYEKLYEWDERHRWHSKSNGAILANVYFQRVGNSVEVSWNNADLEEYVIYDTEEGSELVNKDTFVKVVDEFLKEYANHWF